MNEVLKINYETEQPTVSARELHEALGVASRFSRWFDSNKELFVEGEDVRFAKGWTTSISR